MNPISKSAALSLVAVALLGTARTGQASLVAYYSLNGNTNDSASGYNGTVNGTTAYGAGLGQSQAFSFNGNTNIATTTTDNLGLVNDSFTVDAYVNFATPLNGDLAVLGTLTGATNQGLHLIERGDKPFMGFYSNDTGGNTALAANTWYNLAFVYDVVAQTQTIYVNGVQDAQGTSRSAFQGTGETALIGAACCAGQMNGEIERLGIYNNALAPHRLRRFR